MLSERYDFLDGGVLIAGAVVLACRESERSPHGFSGIELHLIADEGSHIRVFILAAELLQDDGRFLCGAILRVDGHRISLTDYFE